MNIFIDTEDMEERYGEELYKEYLEKQNQQLKSTLEEIREYIKECTLINEISTAIRLKDTLAGKYLLQIIDKESGVK